MVRGPLFLDARCQMLGTSLRWGQVTVQVKFAMTWAVTK